MVTFNNCPDPPPATKGILGNFNMNPQTNYNTFTKKVDVVGVVDLDVSSV